MDAQSESQTTLAFLFTDVEQSSPLWDRRPDEMRQAMKRHDRAFAEIVKSLGGRLFRKTGDGICAAFPEAADALRAAIGANSALCDLPAELQLNVRFAIHVGYVEARDGDYDGEPLVRLARILAFAQGGQILLSAASAALIAPRQLDGVTLRDLGFHSLRGLSAEENIFQVLHSSLSPSAPVILPTLTQGKLPVPPTSFVGRAEQIDHLKFLVEQSRLVTLVGPGGIGKTRLAIETAARLSGQFEHGVWFVDLQNVVEPDLVMAAVAAAVSVKESPGLSLLEAIRYRLASRRLLLVIDNCEQVLDAVSDAVRLILELTPQTHVLATARENLAVRGERVFPVLPLSIPSENSGESRSGAEAVRLFVDRALYANPNFRVTEDNIGLLCRLTRRLDGIPLAVELAAARMRSMSLQQLVDRLEDSFRDLKSSIRDETPRHQTLVAAMDWSYRLLSSKEKMLFARLGVFAATWGLNECQEVAGFGPLRRDELLDLLASLVDKSLVIADEWRGEMRYRFLETLRAYSRTKLAARKDEPLVREKYYDSMSDLARRLDAGIRGQEQLRWRRLFDLEIDNFRSALDWGLQQPERIETVASMLCSLESTWTMSSDFSEARRYFDRVALILPDENLGLKAIVHGLAGMLRVRAGNLSGMQMLRESVQLAEGADPEILLKSLDRLATASFELGHLEEAAELWERALAVMKPLNRPAGYIHLALGAVATERKRFEEAESHYQAMLGSMRELGDVRGVGLAYCYLAHSHQLQGAEDAPEFYRQAISCFARVPDYLNLAANLGAASAILLSDSPSAAANIQGFAEHLRQRIGVIIDPHIAVLAEAAKAAALSALGDEAYEDAFEAGRLLTLDAVTDLMGCTLDSRTES